MTIRQIGNTYHVSCVRCGEGIITLSNPEYMTDAIEHGSGTLIVDKRDIEDCKVACASCADKCLCPNCGALLEADICPDCHIPQNITEFIEEYPGGQVEGMSVYACAVVVDIGKGEQVAIGETSLHVWNRISENRYQVCGIVYAGPDRNEAIQRAEEWNRMYYKDGR